MDWVGRYLGDDGHVGQAGEKEDLASDEVGE